MRRAAKQKTRKKSTKKKQAEGGSLLGGSGNDLTNMVEGGFGLKINQRKRWPGSFLQLSYSHSGGFGLEQSSNSENSQ